jgi:hypothetical protein
MNSAHGGLLAPTRHRATSARLYMSQARRPRACARPIHRLAQNWWTKSPEAFAEHLRTEIIKWGKVVKAAGMRVSKREAAWYRQGNPTK